MLYGTGLEGITMGHAAVPARPEGVAIRLGEASVRYLCPFVASPRAGFENKANKGSKGWTLSFHMH